MPSIAEIRALTQPDEVLGRRDEEHWAGRLYMRRLSPYATRAFVATPITANQVTGLMIASGLLGALVLSLPGWPAALGATLLLQLWLLFDCVDGEVARWRQSRSSRGVYLDGLSHAVTQAALAAALGVRADGGWSSVGGWTALGLLASLLVLLVSLESELVHSVRGREGKLALADADASRDPRSQSLRSARRLAGAVPLFRLFNPIELTMLAFAAALLDTARDDLLATRILLGARLVVAALVALGHLAIILSSNRLQ